MINFFDIVVGAALHLWIAGPVIWLVQEHNRSFGP
jgi:hypothetical protein